jgi:phosphoglycolate phosphatase-like HAD superfamily hydrolase
MIRKLLIWDIDGTLVDCGAAGRKAMDRTFEDLFQVKNGFDGISMSGRLDQVILKDAFERHGVAATDLQVFYDRYEKVLDSVLENTDVRLYQGIEKVLAYTGAHKEMINVISTGNCEVGAWLKLKHAGIDHYFDKGGFGCSFTAREDLVGQVIKDVEAEHQLSFLPENVFVIGDTPHDITSGQHHQATTIAVLTGSYTKEELMAYQPTYIIENFAQIEDFIDMLEV